MTTLNASVRPKAHHFPKAQPMTAPTKTMAEYAAEENKRMRDNAKGEAGRTISSATMRAKIFAAIKDRGRATSRDVCDETGFSLAYVSRILGMEYRAGRLTRERAHRVDPYLYEVAQ